MRSRSQSPISRSEGPVARQKMIGSAVTLTQKLGEGSQGTAWLATCHSPTIYDLPDKPFVVKQQVVARQHAEAVMKEVHIHRKLHHPQVVQFYGAWIEAVASAPGMTSLCIATQHCNRGDLETVIRRTRQKNHRISSPMVENIALQLLLGLEYIHKRHVLHRDIKPANIFVHETRVEGAERTPVKNVRFLLGDMGVSRTVEYTEQQAHTKVGTPYYLSPELVAMRSYTSKTDVWAVGVLLFEIMTNTRPFTVDPQPQHPGESESDFRSRQIEFLYRQIVAHDPMPLLRSRADGIYEPWLLDLVERCLEKNPDQRLSASSLIREWQPAADRLKEFDLEATPSTPTSGGPALRHVSPLSARGRDSSPLARPAGSPRPLVQAAARRVTSVSPVRAASPPSSGKPPTSPVSRRQYSPSPLRAAPSSPVRPPGYALKRPSVGASGDGGSRVAVHHEVFLAAAHSLPPATNEVAAQQLLRLIPEDAFLILRVLACSSKPEDVTNRVRHVLQLWDVADPEAVVAAVVAMSKAA